MLLDRVVETTDVVGTGTMNLLGAATIDSIVMRRFVTIAGSGKTVAYFIVDSAGNWEFGVGVVTSGSPDTLTRATILRSSNADAAVSFTSGTKYVYATANGDLLRFGAQGLPTLGGTADARTMTNAPPLKALVAGMHLVAINGAAANATATPTLVVDAISAKTVAAANGGALPVGAMAADALVMFVYDGTNLRLAWSSFNGGTLTAALTMSGAAINEAQGADIASAATLDLDAATGNLVDVTGTTGITAITLSQGRERVVRFAGALTLTHGASLVLPGAANITTAAGDFAVFRGYAAGVVRCVAYSRADGTPLAGSLAAASQSDQETATSTTTYVSPGRQHFHPSAAKAWVRFHGTGTAGMDTSYNTTSITDEGTGDYTWTIATDFSSVNWCMVGSCWITATNTGALCRKSAVALAAGSARVTTFSIGAGALADADEVYLVGFGDI